MLKDGRIETLFVVLHILDLAKNLIFVSEMSDASVHTIFEKYICKIIQEAMILMMGV